VLCATVSAGMDPDATLRHVVDQIVAQLARDPCGDHARAGEARDIVRSMLSTGSGASAGVLTREQLALHPHDQGPSSGVRWSDVLNQVVLPALASRGERTSETVTLRDLIVVLRDEECGSSAARFLACVKPDALLGSRVRFVVAGSGGGETSSIAEVWLESWLRIAKLNPRYVRSVSLSTERGEHSANAEACLDDARRLALQVLGNAVTPETANEIVARVAVPGVTMKAVSDCCRALALEARSAGGGGGGGDGCTGLVPGFAGPVDEWIKACLVNVYETQLKTCEERIGPLPAGVAYRAAALIAAATFVRARLGGSDIALILDDMLSRERPTEDADDESILDPKSASDTAIQIVLSAHVAVKGDRDGIVTCPPDDAATHIAYWKSKGDSPTGDGVKRRKLFRSCLTAIARFAAGIVPDQAPGDRAGPRGFLREARAHIAGVWPAYRPLPPVVRQAMDREVFAVRRFALISGGMAALNSDAPDAKRVIAEAFNALCATKWGLHDLWMSLLSLLDEAHENRRGHPAGPLMPHNGDEAEAAADWILDRAAEYASSKNNPDGGDDSCGTGGGGGDWFLGELLGRRLPQVGQLGGDGDGAYVGAECESHTDTLLCAAAYAGCAKVVAKILGMALSLPETDPTGGTSGAVTGPCARAFGAPDSLTVLRVIREFGTRSPATAAASWCRLPVSALHIAAERGDLDALEWVLDEMKKEDRAKAQRDTGGVNLLEPIHPLATPLLLVRGPHEADISIRSAPLHVACARGDLRAVELLLGHGADPTAKDSLGRTPLHVAADAGNSSVVAALVAGAQRWSEPPTLLDFLSAADSEKWTPLHLAVAGGAADFCAEVRAAVGSDASTWQSLVCKGSRWRPSPLHLAAISSGAGSGAVVRELLEPAVAERGAAGGSSHVRGCLGATFSIQGGDVSWTMLHMAAIADNTPAIQAVAGALWDFPREGAELRELWARPSGISPLHAAFYANAVSAASALLGCEWPWSGEAPALTLADEKCVLGRSPVECALLGARDCNTELWRNGWRIDGAHGEGARLREVAEEAMGALLRLHYTGRERGGSEGGTDSCASGGGVPLVTLAARLGLVGTVRLLIESHSAVLTVADVLNAVPFICAEPVQCAHNAGGASAPHSAVVPSGFPLQDRESMAMGAGPGPIPDLLGLAGGRSLPSQDRNALLAAAVRYGCPGATVVALVEDNGADPCGLVPHVPVAEDQDDREDSLCDASADTATVTASASASASGDGAQKGGRLPTYFSTEAMGALPSALRRDETDVKRMDALALLSLMDFAYDCKYLDAARDPMAPHKPSAPPAAQWERSKSALLRSATHRRVASEASLPASRTSSGSPRGSHGSALGHQPAAADRRASLELPGSPVPAHSPRRERKHKAPRRSLSGRSQVSVCDECSGLSELARRCVDDHQQRAGVEAAVNTIADAIAVCVSQNTHSVHSDVTCLALALGLRDPLALERLLCGPDLGDTAHCSLVAEVAGTQLSSTTINALVQAAGKCGCDPRASSAFVTAAVCSAVVAGSATDKFDVFIRELEQLVGLCSPSGKEMLTPDGRLDAPVPVHPTSVLKVAFEAALASGLSEVAVCVYKCRTACKLDRHVKGDFKEWCFQRASAMSEAKPEVTYDTVYGMLANDPDQDYALALARGGVHFAIRQGEGRDGGGAGPGMPVVCACLDVYPDAACERILHGNSWLVAHAAAKAGRVDVLKELADRARQRAPRAGSHDPSACPWVSLWGKSGRDSPAREQGLTVLHLAAQHHQVEAVDFLLSEEAKPSCKRCGPIADAAGIDTIAPAGPWTDQCCYATTPLGFAVMRPTTGEARKVAQRKVVGALIKDGAWLGPFLTPGGISRLENSRATPGVIMTAPPSTLAPGAEETHPLHVVGPASIAAWSGDHASLYAMLNHLPEAVEVDAGVRPFRGRDYICPVHCLCARGDIAMALELIGEPGLRTLFRDNGALESACALPALNDDVEGGDLVAPPGPGTRRTGSHLLPNLAPLPRESAIHVAVRNPTVLGDGIKNLCETVPGDRALRISTQKDESEEGRPLTPLGTAIACGNLAAAKVLLELRERALESQPGRFGEVESGTILESLARGREMRALVAPLYPRHQVISYGTHSRDWGLRARSRLVGALYYYIEKERDNKLRRLPARNSRADDPEWSISREHDSLVFHIAYVSREDVSVDSAKLVFSEFRAADAHTLPSNRGTAMVEVGMEPAGDTDGDGFRAFALTLPHDMRRDGGDICKGNLDLRCRSRTDTGERASYFELRVPISFRGKEPGAKIPEVKLTNPFVDFALDGATPQGERTRTRAKALARSIWIASLVVVVEK
jgi:ankyrin repeat protein